MRILVIAMTCAAVLWTREAQAGSYYKYVDEQGVLHITNTPRKQAGSWEFMRRGSNPAKKSPPPGATSHPPPPNWPIDSQSPQNIAAEGSRYTRFDPTIRSAAQLYQLPESLIRAVIHTESNYVNKATSRVGAMGLMQLMPSTAKFLGVREPFDPQQNIFGGARLLRLLANRYGGDMILVLAAYNAGAGNVEKFKGVPPFQETRNYVRACLRRFYEYERKLTAELSGRNIVPSG